MLGNDITVFQALIVTVVCMLSVFIILFLLSLILDSFKYFLKEKKIETDVLESEKAELKNLDSEQDIVACISAAVMASEGRRSSRINIKSIKRIR